MSDLPRQTLAGGGFTLIFKVVPSCFLLPPHKGRPFHCWFFFLAYFFLKRLEVEFTVFRMRNFIFVLDSFRFM